MNHLLQAVYIYSRLLIGDWSMARIVGSHSIDFGDSQFGALIGSLTSVIVIIIGIVLIKNRNKLLINGVSVEGIVFNIVENGGPDEFTYYPVIRFVTIENKEWITRQSAIGGQYGSYNEGDKVKVTYDPNEPTNFITYDWRSKYAGKIFIGVGVVGLLFSLGIVVF